MPFNRDEVLVNYVTQTGERRPAIIVRVFNEGDEAQRANLLVFLDGTNDTGPRNPGAPDTGNVGYTRWETSAAYSGDVATPGTWHWLGDNPADPRADTAAPATGTTRPAQAQPGTLPVTPVQRPADSSPDPQTTATTQAAATGQPTAQPAAAPATQGTDAGQATTGTAAETPAAGSEPAQ